MILRSNALTDTVSTHSARMALNRDPALREWVENWLRAREKEFHPDMSEDEFAKHWRYVKPERVHEGAVEAVAAFNNQKQD